MPPEWLASLVSEAKALFDPHTDQIEITLEANPTDSEISRYQAFRDAGVNRLSLGVQSLDDDALKFLGRNHSAAEAVRGIETAQSVFGRVSLDLIYALPGQSVEAWRDELGRAIGLGVEHVSPYQLTIESSTAFGRAVRCGAWKPVDDEAGEAFYFVTQDVLESSGFEAYEVSNHAKGPTARSAHNIFVWEGVDYIGIVPAPWPADAGRGAPRHHRAQRSQSLYRPRRRDRTGHDREALSPLEAEEEAVLLGMRLSDGLDLARTPSLDLTAKAAPLIADGYLRLNHNRLSATPKGRVLLDRILLELLS